MGEFLFLSTLSLRRATRRHKKHLISQAISIHALLAESDPLIFNVQPRKTISIHALLAESDGYEQYCIHAQGISIHALLAESDATDKSDRSDFYNFYPRSPCGERPHCYQQTAYFFYFYPRSPCGERLRQRLIEFRKLLFLSTLSLRRATITTTTICTAWKFLSTLSLRRATLIRYRISAK